MTKDISKVKSISENIWKVVAFSNIYLLKLDENILIDTGMRTSRRDVELFLSRLVNFNDVSKVIFTHLHYDHIGNFDLFPNAEFFAGSEEIESFKQDPFGAILSKDMVEKFYVELKQAEELNIKELEIIKTPGHTKGAICVWYDKEKILFSGDTLFPNENIGRIDLPNSAPDEMRKSLMRLMEYKFKILCPGHDY